MCHTCTCKCRACSAVPDHQLHCLWCGICHFGYHGPDSYTTYDFDYEFDDGVGWFCPPCFEKQFDNRTKVGCKSIAAAPDWFNVFEKNLNERLKVMDTKIDTSVDLLSNDLLNIQNNVNAHVDEMPKKVDDLAEQLLNNQSVPLAGVNQLSSPPRKAMKGVWSGFNDKVNMPHDMPIHASSFRPTKELNADDMKNVKITLENASPESLHKTLHEHGMTLPSFNTKRNLNGAVDVLFKNFADANKAKVILESKLNDTTVGEPIPCKLKRYKLVGLGFEMSCEEATDSIVTENEHWLNLVKMSDTEIGIKNDPLSVMHVEKVVKCRKRGFMVYVMMSPNMVASIGYRRLSVGHSICKRYNYVYHRRCFKCQKVGHVINDCKNPVACGRCASAHHTHECTSDILKCVNCFNHNRHDYHHPSYSDLCPFNTT